MRREHFERRHGSSPASHPHICALRVGRIAALISGRGIPEGTPWTTGWSEAAPLDRL
jgi:hypothetical protein